MTQAGSGPGIFSALHTFRVNPTTTYEIGTIIIMPVLQTRTLQPSYTTGLEATQLAQLVEGSACGAGGPGSIPGSGRSREGIGHPLQCSCLEVWTEEPGGL